MSITFDFPDNLASDLARYAERNGQTPDAFIAEALRRQLAVEEFRETRERLSGYGPRAGLTTDEDVFAVVS